MQAGEGIMKRILVVEDETAIREVIALNLKMGGYEVEAAASAGVDSVEHGAYLDGDSLAAMKDLL